MSKIFISYKRQDKDKVFPIVEEIKKKTGVDCWIDLQDIESGDQFQNVIIDAIDNAEIVVVMLSRAFISPYKDEKTGKVDLTVQTFPQKEVMYAINEKKRIVPISIDGTTVNDCKWMKFNCSGLDYIKWNDATQREKLLGNLCGWFGTKNDDDVKVDEVQPDDDTEPANKFFSLLNQHRIKLNLLPLLAAVVLLVVVIISSGQVGGAYSPIVYTSVLITVIALIGALFNKRLFGLRRFYHAFAYYLPAIFLFVVCIAVPWAKVRNDHPDEQTQNQQVLVSENIQSVDLGLTSGTLWADRNVGADCPDDYGNLYSWGEVSPKKDYRGVCYDEIKVSVIIGTNNDVATEQLGKGWQMPSKEQFDELIKECQWEWKKNGFTVIGKNGKSIFLPASGWSCSSVVEYRDQYGYYWTGNKVNSKFAIGLLFSQSEQKTGNCTLHYGRSVRAVAR